MKKILIIDDEEKLRGLLSRIIKLEGFDIVEAPNLKAGMKLLEAGNIQVVLCDVKLPDGSGVDFVGEAKAKFTNVEFILLTAYGNISDGVRAIKNGAFDYIIKGDDNDKIIPLLSQAMDKVSLKAKASVKIIETSTRSFSDVIGQSAVIKKAISLAEKIAATDTTVLLMGETGTGKEVFANAIHYSSKRKDKNFIAINCSAFSKDLLESELFGHKAGAYTGALKDKKGLIELADGGSLFLDEIGEMNIDLQAKLLRVLENGEFIKVGDVKTSKVDVRIIAATNRNLNKEIETGNFREDLFYRLNVFSIELPALRERAEDIEALAVYFVKQLSSKLQRGNIAVSKDAIRLLQKHTWKGNIRELRNVLERAIIVTDENEINASDLPYEIQNEDKDPTNNLSMASVEKQHIRKVLTHTRGNKTETAKLLDIGLTTLYRKIEEYKLS